MYIKVHSEQDIYGQNAHVATFSQTLSVEWPIIAGQKGTFESVMSNSVSLSLHSIKLSNEEHPLASSFSRLGHWMITCDHMIDGLPKTVDAPCAVCNAYCRLHAACSILHAAYCAVLAAFGMCCACCVL